MVFNLNDCIKRFKKTLWLLLMLFCLPLAADELETRDGRFFYGQLVRVYDERVELLMIEPDTLQLVERAFPRKGLKQVTDESGTALMRDGMLLVEDPLSYYRPLRNNWEFLRKQVVDSLPDSVRFETGQWRKGTIVSLDEEALFLEKDSLDNNGKIVVDKIALADLRRVNGYAVRKIGQAYYWPDEKELEYKWELELGADARLIPSREIETLFARAYEGAGLNVEPKNRPASVSGLYAATHLNLARRWQLLLSLHYSAADEANRLTRSAAALRYKILNGTFSAGLRAGVVFGAWRFAGRDIEMEEDFEWRGSAAGILLGADLEWQLSPAYGLRLTAEHELNGKRDVDFENNDVIASTSSISWDPTRLALGLVFYF